MRAIADIHCHILPCVDDGAEHIAEMEELLKAEARAAAAQEAYDAGAEKYRNALAAGGFSRAEEASALIERFGEEQTARTRC